MKKPDAKTYDNLYRQKREQQDQPGWRTRPEVESVFFAQRGYDV